MVKNNTGCYMFEYFIPAIIGLVVIGYVLFGKNYLVERRRDKIRAQAFPEAWRRIIRVRMPYFKQMPADLQLQLKKHIQVFLAEKNFVGVQGLSINDEVKVTIAAQACLLLLNRKTDYYPKLKTIVVYPSAFVKTETVKDQTGLHSEQRSVMLGESWSYGKIILSWQHTVHGAQEPNDGSNLVIHEFAHQLDSEDGEANGAPILGKDGNYQCWSHVFEAEFNKLRENVDYGEPTLLDAYGATNPAEFFAVASEVFFERSVALFNQHRSLYTQLKTYYRVDPVNWH